MPNSLQPEALPPCAETLAVLATIDPFSLPAHEQIELLVELESHAAWLDSLRADALAAIVGSSLSTVSNACSPEAFVVENAVEDEVAAALRISNVTAGRRIKVAQDLHEKLPHTRDLLRRGVCTYAHAVAIADECDRLSAREACTVEIKALGRIATQTPALTRRSVRRAVAAVSPVDPVAFIDEEFARRDVSMFHDGGVMATITATLPAPDAIAVWNALTACAHRETEPGDSRTIAHRRADALTDWAHHAFEDPTLPTMQGKKRLETQVVIDVATLFGLANEPGEIVGYGPIPAPLARRLAAESGTWRRLVTDTVSGHLLDFGSRTYTPPAELREYVIARDRTCQFPGCARAAYLCDLDHAKPFTGNAHGGSTSASNLIALCRRHHRLKTHGHWKVEIDEPPADSPGAEHRQAMMISWQSPRGVNYALARPSPSPSPSPPCTEFERALKVELRAAA